MTLHTLLSAACIALFQTCSVAQDVQARAEALLQHARQLSDIRSARSPAFRLKATFSFIGDDLQTVHGTYTEVWVSNSQWHRETAIGDLRHIEVGGVGKHWTLFPDGFPQQVDKLSALLAIFPPVWSKFDFTSVNERSTAGLSGDCAYTKPVMLDLQASFCFEKNSGLFLEEASPKRRLQNIVRYSCGFRTFRKFGDHLFPRDLYCFEDRHKTMTVVVDDLSLESSPDPALFVSPSGAAEIGECSGKSVPPTQTKWGIMMPDPDHILGHVPLIKVWFVVDTKGEPQNIKVMNFAHKGTVDDLLKIIQTWRYNPGTCDGKSTPMVVSPEVPALLPRLQPH